MPVNTLKGFTYKHLILTLIAILLLICTLAPYQLSFFADDSMISLRYSQRLIEGKGLTWNDGEYVEGYSNFLWVLLNAGLGYLGFDLITACRGLCFLMALLTLLLVNVFFSRNPSKSLVAPTAASVLLATSLPFALWSVGGLEQMLVAMLLILAIAFSRELLIDENTSVTGLCVPAFALGGICLTRPDGPLYVVAFVGALFWNRGFNRSSCRDAGLLTLIPFSFYFIHLAWRLHYYSNFVPNTAHIKLPASPSRVLNGLAYVGKGAFWCSPIVVPALYTMWRRSSDPQVRLLTVVCGLWTVYLIFIGGDIFSAFRHLIPILAPLAILAGLAIERLPLSSPRSFAKLAIPLIAVSVLFQSMQPLQVDGPADTEVIGRLLHDAFYEEQILIAVNVAGAIPYHSQLPSIDMLGLNDAHIAKCTVSKLGKGWLGHDHADADYVLRRQPEIIVLGATGGVEHENFPSDVGLLQDPRLAQNYNLVQYAGFYPEYHSNSIWIVKYGGKLGVQTQDNMITIPGYHLATVDGATASMHSSGKFGAEVKPGARALSFPLNLEAGTWSISLSSSSSQLRAQLIDGHNQKVLYSVENSIELLNPKVVSIEVLQPAGTGLSSHLFEVRLIRK